MVAVAVTTRVSGTSSGMLWRQLYGTRTDPRLVFGQPRGIRSDEWAVTTPVLQSQASQHFPVVNRVLGGGVNVSFVYDVPFRDWPMIFRPQMLGFWFLDVERAFSLRWWLPPAVLVLSAYALVQQLLPGHLLLAASIGPGLVLAPFTQWWFTAAIGPLAWSVAALASWVWLVRSERRRALILRTALLAYALTSLAFFAYPPFVLPAGLVLGAWMLGHLDLRRHTHGWRDAAHRGVALVLSASAAGIAIFAFLKSRSDVVQQLTDTVYPGNRSVPAGGFSVRRLLLGQLSMNLQNAAVETTPGALDGFGGNQCEASTFVMVGALAVLAHAWLLWRARRMRQVPNGVVIALLLILAAFLADLLLPAATPLAQLLSLDVVPHERLTLGLGLVSTLLIIAAAWEFDRLELRPPTSLAVVTWLGVAVLLVTVGLGVHASNPLLAGPLWLVLLTSTITAGLAALVASRRAGAAAAGLLAVNLASSFGVNPLYLGLLDLRKTEVGEAIRAAESAQAGGWLALGSFTLAPHLIQSLVPTYSPPMAYPVDSFWRDLDPDGVYVDAYNRYAHVVFTEDQAGALVQNPSPDVASVRFEACGYFAQKRIAHVLATQPARSRCLALRQAVQLPAGTFLVYDVVAP